MKMVFKHENIPFTHNGKISFGESILDITRSDDVKEYLLMYLRKSFPELITLHRQKKHNQNNKVITIGAGKGGVYYRLSVKDRRGLAFVEILMDANQESLFDKFEKQQKNNRRRSRIILLPK